MKQQPHTEEERKPLWKVLNEQRTQGELELNPFGRKDILQINNGEAERWQMGNFCTCYGENETERMANTNYTALAVNNLHILAEALQKQIDEWHSKDSNFHKQEPPSLKAAREALSKIS